MQKNRGDKYEPNNSQAKEEMMFHRSKVREKILRMPKARIDDLTINILSDGSLGKIFSVDSSSPFKTLDTLKETIIHIHREAEREEDIYLLKKTNDIMNFINRALEPVFIDTAVFIAQMKRPPTPEEVATKQIQDAQYRVELTELKKKVIANNKFVREQILPMESKGGYTVLCFIDDIKKTGLPLLDGSLGDNWVMGYFGYRGQEVDLLIGLNMELYNFSMLVPNSKIGDDIVDFFNKKFCQFPNVVYMDVDDPSKMHVLYLLGKETEKKWLLAIAEDTTKKLIATNYYDNDITKWGKPED
jgi:hypothetical protein